MATSFASAADQQPADGLQHGEASVFAQGLAPLVSSAQFLRFAAAERHP